MRLETDPVRCRLVGDLAGEILEIGTGTGTNFRFYSPAAYVIATDYSPHMLAHARSEAGRAAARIELQLADAADLPFADDRFDAVVSTLVLCSVPAQQAALAEIRRVLKPGGTLRLLEHVRSDRPAIAALQHLLSPVWSQIADGCRLDRDSAAAVRAAGFEIEAVEVARMRMPMKHVVLSGRRPR